MAPVEVKMEKVSVEPGPSSELGTIDSRPPTPYFSSLPHLAVMAPVEVKMEIVSMEPGPSSELGTIDSRPPTPEHYYTKHRSGSIITGEVRQLILNCYVKLRRREPRSTVEGVCNAVADLLGFSARTVFRVRSEAKKTGGVLKTPSQKRRRRSASVTSDTVHKP